MGTDRALRNLAEHLGRSAESQHFARSREPPSADSISSVNHTRNSTTAYRVPATAETAVVPRSTRVQHVMWYKTRGHVVILISGELL